MELMDRQKQIKQIGFIHVMSIATFAASMGYCGLCFGWRFAHQLWGIPSIFGEIFGAVAIAVYLLVLGCYVLKIKRDFGEVRAEWGHPMKSSFFGTFTVSTVLLSAVLAPYVPQLAVKIWWVAIVLILLFSWAILTHWLLKRQYFNHVSPGWLLPVLGPITIPIAGNILQPVGYHDISIFCVSVGIVTSIPVITLLLGRMIIGRPLPDSVQPGIMILMAPFGMGYITYTDTFGVDSFAMIFICVGLFMLPPIVIKVISVVRRSPFRMSWWAMSFPSMAFTNGVLKLTLNYGVWWNYAMSVIFLGAGTILILALSARTLVAVKRKELAKLY